MYLKNLIKDSTLFEFLMLAPLDSILILIGSFISGFLQSVSALLLLPLMAHLNFTVNDPTSMTFIHYFEVIISWFSLDNSLFTILCFLVLATWSIKWMDYFIKAYSARASAKITKDLRKKIIEGVMKASWSYFVKKKTGSVIHSVVTEGGKTVAGFRDSINFISAILQGTVLLFTTFMVSPIVSLAVILTGIFFAIIFYPWISYAKQVGARTGKLLESITSRLSDGLHGLKPIKAMNNDRFLIPLLNQETFDLEKQEFRGFLVSKLPVVFRDSIFILIVAVGAYFAIEYSQIPTASLLPMLFLFRGAVNQFSGAQGLFQAQKGMEPYYISLKKNLSEAERMVEKWEGTLDPVFNDRIKIKNLKFAYSTTSVLKDLSIEIPKNSFVALMGESGGGKTTFSDILCALYQPDSGDVLVDDKNLLLLDINKWRQMIGYVPQDLFLFHDNVFNNVNLGDVKISKEKVKESLIDAGAWDFVSSLPEGMHTVIGERGIRLSGGQRQRISIARAIIRKPQLLILDEATTALDPKTEERILKTIRKLTEKGITVVAVSHQKAVLNIADKVYNLESGRFKEVSSLKPNKISK